MKIHFSVAKNKKAKIAYSKLVKSYGQVEIYDAEVIVAVGGDGSMLNALRESLSLIHI